MSEKQIRNQNTKKSGKKQKKKKKKKKHIFLKLFLTLVFIVVICAGVFVGYSTLKNGWGLKGMVQTAMGQSEEKLKDLNPFTVLCLGISEDISSKLTDTIIIASYNPKTQIATMISIPRDTFIGKNKNNADSYDKINALYQKSPEKTLEAVNKLTGLNIKYYAAISNNAVVELVDAIGGVEFDVPIKMVYDDAGQKLHIRLDRGLQTLNGEQAEGLLRYRKPNTTGDKSGEAYSEVYGNDDFGRMRTQRDFIKAVVQQTVQLKNISKIGSFIDIFKNNITTNINNWSLIKDYIPYAIDFNPENIQMETIPGESKNLGLWFFLADEEATKERVKELFDKQNGVEDETDGNITTNSTANTSSSESTTTSNSKIKIELLNGSGDDTLLTKATKILKNKGYNVYKTGPTNLTSKTTIINKTSVSSDVTNNIKSALECGNISSSITSNSSVDITIVLGKDYK